MRFDDPHQAAVEFFGVGGMQELVGPVRVGVRTEHAGDQELSLREALAQHGHEGNGTAEAEITGLLAKELLGTGVRHLGQPRRQGRGAPTIRATGRHGNTRPKWRLCFEDTLDGRRRPVRLQRRGEAQGQLVGQLRQQHIARLGH